MIPTTKHTLRFHEDGSFRILMVSDLQDKLEYDPRTLAGFDAVPCWFRKEEIRY